MQKLDVQARSNQGQVRNKHDLSIDQSMGTNHSTMGTKSSRFDIKLARVSTGQSKMGTKHIIVYKSGKDGNYQYIQVDTTPSRVTATH